MKTILGIVLIVILLFMFSGCSDDRNTESSALNSTTRNYNTLYFEKPTDVSKQFIDGNYINVIRDKIKIPPETIYMESSEAVGFDNISIFGINGNLTMMFDGTKTVSCSFGSKTFTDKLDFINQINRLNDEISKELNVSSNDFVLVCSDKSLEESEAVFKGKGVIKTDYETETYKLSISAIGAKNEATITVTQLRK